MSKNPVKVRIRAVKPVSLAVFSNLMIDFIKLVNHHYFLHPEYECKEDYMNGFVKPKYPNYDFYLNTRSNTIQVNI